MTLHWTSGVEEDRIRFGKPVSRCRIDGETRRESYAAGQVFALLRRTANVYGTTRVTLAVLRAVGQGEAFTTHPGVDPGADILLSVSGWSAVRQVLSLIEAMEAGGIDPCSVSPDHWRHIHNRIAAGMSPRSYGHRTHSAFRLRERLLP